MTDTINPQHYRSHPSGVECIQITEWMNFCLGNAVKYLWRAGLKSDDPVEDLRKARWYIDREIARLDGLDFGVPIDSPEILERVRQTLDPKDHEPSPPAVEGEALDVVLAEAMRVRLTEHDEDGVDIPRLLP